MLRYSFFVYTALLGGDSHCGHIACNPADQLRFIFMSGDALICLIKT
jgi:hypothetical protein